MILTEIANRTKERIQECKQLESLSELKMKVADMNCESDFPFEKAIAKDELSFICEVKKASPSKGVIVPYFPYLDIAREYEAAGADAISVLTEPYYFKGDNFYLKQIRKAVQIPILRKDFTIDEYMIYEAKVLGADAILLICSILSMQQLKEYSEIAHSIGLSVLIETHSEVEIEMALDANARIIGVNNRNLQDFSVDINRSIKLRSLVPNHILYVSESGLSNRKDIENVRNNGTNAVLMGEAFMLATHKKAFMEQLR